MEIKLSEDAEAALNQIRECFTLAPDDSFIVAELASEAILAFRDAYERHLEGECGRRDS
jgi:hypothetical protein